MTPTITTRTTPKKPCGCGGSGSATSSGCGCGCNHSYGCGCETCVPQTYSRPEFFAGQLLTEDDLQSLGDYVVAKNRLHNRYLFGKGVVCGLTVACPPCGSGHVTVNPGYALDCCGNDIVVSCPKDLDINQMVQQLLLKLRKADCGDPCSGASTNGATLAASVPRRYCLYIDYCEQPSDPVAPYNSGSNSGASCGQGVCQPTRVQETFRFELRCPPPAPEGSQIAARFAQCVGDPKTVERTVASAEFLRRYLPSLKDGLAAVRDYPAPPLDAAFWNALKDHTQILKTSADRFAKFRPKETDDAKLRPVLEQVLHLASDVARVWVNPDPRIEEQHREMLADAEDKLRSASDSIRAEMTDLNLSRTLARVRAFALLDLTHELVEESIHSREALEAESALNGALRHSLDFRLLTAGVVFNRHVLAAVAEAQVAMREWLIDRMAQQQGGTHCTLLCDVEGVTLPAPRSTAEADVAAANLAVSGGLVLITAVQELLRSCACGVWIPECTPCDNPGVLLACLTVKDCKVIDICNLDRKFVLTGPNIRYWFPEIGRMGEVLEEWCCPTCRKEPDDRDTGMEALAGSYEGSLRAALGHTPPYTKLAMSTILQPSGQRRGPLEFLAPMISNWRTEEVSRSSAATELQKQLDSALAEIKTLRRDQTKLRERVAKIETKKAREEKS